MFLIRFCFLQVRFVVHLKQNGTRKYLKNLVIRIVLHRLVEKAINRNLVIFDCQN